ncbi:helix-turn-helix protein [Lachnotalea glycerini]|jgi:DNA-binding transcriptional ArsR family regulator|uniref:ArsR family transcriptional regulator n=1 Tax=Lachnotalea glycerini TaxID=1763509 RepID=A0A255I9J4_9FIRM|nr:helix-turn-helix domain-containing protein [Lachnotalea glycerini]PXV96115.1 helix-turn-helix protein [Lachnotalea glycerini]RDY31309.1 ArsR family transcriptional regulator [Lachnotalea glycerini]
MDITKIIMNPVRLRIIQYLVLHGSASTGQIKEELTDIPPASLYRHIKILEEAKLIIVVKENKIRGVVEKVFQLNKENPLSQENSNENIKRVIDSSMLSIMSEFNSYLDKEENDPQKDLLFLSTSTLLLSDEEFTEFTKEIGEIFNRVLNYKKNDKRKVRRITVISSPCEE